jgi:outer membrane lipoprotein
MPLDFAKEGVYFSYTYTPAATRQFVPTTRKYIAVTLRFARANTRRTSFWLAFFVSSTLIANCAQERLKPFRAPMPENPALTQVSGNVSEFTGRRARWGGLIVRVDRHSEGIALEIIERALDINGRPELSGASSGHFITTVTGKAKQWANALGRDVTIIGTIQGDEVRKLIGGEQRFVRLKAETYHLWYSNDGPRSSRDPGDPRDEWARSPGR